MHRVWFTLYLSDIFEAVIVKYNEIEHNNKPIVSYRITVLIKILFAQIKEINKTYRGLDRVTDVISFALEDNLDDTGLELRMLGDIYISIPRMIEQANSYLHSEKRELSFLVVHGMLHLLGYDHTRSKEEEELQFGIQDEILDNLDIRRWIGNDRN